MMVRPGRRRMAAFVPTVGGQLEADGAVLVWRLPYQLSQSRLGDRRGTSNACTIIALRMADAMHSQCVSFALPAKVPLKGAQLPRQSYLMYGSSHGCSSWSAQSDGVPAPRNSAGLSSTTPGFGVVTRSRHNDSLRGLDSFWSALPSVGVPADADLVSALINSIVDGNDVHECAMQCRPADQQNFTIPDAIDVCEKGVCEIDFTTVRGPVQQNVVGRIREAIAYWNAAPQSFSSRHMFLLLIAFERSVLLVYQPHEQIIGLIDSHSHGQAHGALLATAKLVDLSTFCQWFINEVFPESNHGGDDQQEFEISLIQCSPRCSSQHGSAMALRRAAGDTGRWSTGGGMEVTQCEQVKGNVFTSSLVSANGGAKRTSVSRYGASSGVSHDSTVSQFQQNDLTLTARNRKYAKYASK